MTDNLSAVLPHKKNLYRLTMSSSDLPQFYVVASDPTEAQSKVLTPINADSYGFSSDRLVTKIELVAEDYLYTKTGACLFV